MCCSVSWRGWKRTSSNSISAEPKFVPVRFLSSKMMKTRPQYLQKQEIADVEKTQDEYKPKLKLGQSNRIKKRHCTKIGVIVEPWHPSLTVNSNRVKITTSQFKFAVNDGEFESRSRDWNHVQRKHLFLAFQLASPHFMCCCTWSVYFVCFILRLWAWSHFVYAYVFFVFCAYLHDLSQTIVCLNLRDLQLTKSKK